MRPAITNSVQYDSGSGGYLSVHTVASGFDCSGNNTCLELVAYQRNPDSEISSATANSTSMTAVDSSVNVNVCGVKLFRHLINNSSVTVVINTPSFKLCASTARRVENVNQTTPIAQTQKTGTFSSSQTTSITTGSANNKVSAAVNTQNARTLSGSNIILDKNFDPADGNLGQSAIGDTDATGTTQASIGTTSTSGDNWRLLVWEWNEAVDTIIPDSLFFSNNF